MAAPASESVSSDANLQPQGTVSLQNASFPSSVNSPTTFFFPGNLLISNISSRDPTSKQKQAIATLKIYHNSDILAWHKLSQSTEPGIRHREGPGGLSIQEIHAISTLSDCSHQNLVHWLQSGTLVLHKFPGKLQATDNVDSKPRIPTKPRPFRLWT